MNFSRPEPAGADARLRPRWCAAGVHAPWALATCAALVCALTLPARGQTSGKTMIAQASTLSASAQRAGASGAADMTLDFVNAEIEAVARTIATISGHNVVVDPRVRGTMTLTSTVPVTPAEALRLFAAQLRTQGFTLISNDGIDLVLPEAEAKLQAGPVSAGPVRGGSRIETQIFRLKHEDANNLVPVLRPLISPNNTINADPDANALVITDYGDNLKRLASIIATLDTAQATQVEVVPLHHTVALDLAPLIERLLDSGQAGAAVAATSPNAQVRTANVAVAGGGAYRTTILPEPSSNAIIVRAANNAKLAEALELIRRLDQAPGGPTTTGDHSNIHVVYLKNADASKLAVTLRAALAALPGRAERQDAGAGASTGGNTANSRSATAQNVAQRSMSSSSTGASSGFESGPTIDADAGNQPSTGGQIQADPSTNSLIISAAEPVYRELRAAIDKLDGRRAQVFVESLIAEVRTDKMAEFGVQWQGILGRAGDRNVGVMGTNFGTTGNILGVSGGLSDLISNQRVPDNLPLNQGLNLGLLHRFGPGYLLNALANFIQTSGAGNVLSTPTLLTLDNEEARIVVGQNVPFVTGSYANTGVGNNVINPFQTFERQDVGLTLRVRPQISEDGTIKMVLYQETSDVDRSSINSPQGIIVNKRAIESSVLVNDGQIVVLGGLLQDEFSTSQSKVPVLGDVPVVGNLFKNDTRSHVKTNLMVFLRPVIVRDANATEGYSLSRYDYLRAMQEANQPEPSSILRINRAPVAPPVEPGNPASRLQPAPAPLSAPPAKPRRTWSEPAPSDLPAAGESNYYGG